MTSSVTTLFRDLGRSTRDLLPVVTVVLFFQFVVIRQPLPEHLNLDELLTGLMFVIVGLTLFTKGLKLGLFPLGEGLAKAFVRKGSAPLLLLFGFCLGFGSTFAEPALLAVSGQAAIVVSEAGLLTEGPDAASRFQLVLRSVVALAVGCAVVLGIFRIIFGWPLHIIVIGCYMLAMLLTLPAPPEIVGIAFDSGGVTTSTMTVPLLTALGVGLASTISGRNPMLDGFGLIAFASVIPIIFVLLFGLISL